MSRTDRGKWAGLCHRALQHLLLVEHWEAASEADLTGWQAEIVAFREQMAKAIKGGRGMHGKFEEMFSKAWPDARKRAVERLVSYSAPDGERRLTKRHTRAFEAQVPKECPYLLEHVAGYDPKRDEGPRKDIWPPEVAKVFNRVLGTKYEILRERSPGSDDPWGRGRLRGRARGTSYDRGR